LIDFKDFANYANVVLNRKHRWVLSTAH